jgi:predicted heme/steroid binding protein
MGEHYFPDKPIHKQSAHVYFIKFEGKVYEISFLFPKSKHQKLKSPVKNLSRLLLQGD